MKTNMLTLIIASSLMAAFFHSTAQNSLEMHMLSEHFRPASQIETVRDHQDQPGGGVINTAFYIYKTFISSQDHMSCVFTPSCSEYALHAIQSQGMVFGFMNTFDRLTRCNGLRPHDYAVDPRIQRFVDPVRNAHYERP